MVVADLVQQGGASWDPQRLIDAFGFGTALFISIKFPVPPLNALHQDRLILTTTRTGKFSFKAAYHLLASSSNAVPSMHTELLKLIWHSPGILPRIQIFLWKLLWDALPVQGSILNRLGSPTPPCVMCQQGPENTIHALFLCHHARAFWFASPLCLRFDSSIGSVAALLNSLSTTLRGRLFVSFANLLWALWKHRCSFVYEGKKFAVQAALYQAAYYNQLSIASSNMTLSRKLGQPRHEAGHMDGTVAQGMICFVDGSFDTLKKGGWAFLIFDKGRLLYYGADSGSVSSPFLAELKAMEAGVRAVIQLGTTCCLFYTDYQHLQQVLSGKAPPDSVHWMEYQHTPKLSIHILIYMTTPKPINNYKHPFIHSASNAIVCHGTVPILHCLSKRKPISLSNETETKKWLAILDY
ncbi:Ribonuclease H-like superfamily protein [Rhynchospora pubera]|uniref:Ribonuclease H-like superfamily protein n=1 Tax=Rhynchospora pubera TaxID=906938 RepID=A0AAV8FD62_9POAL|nr:Ribonuclease H-like superfamily protein [Rhynchospora pubera]